MSWKQRLANARALHHANADSAEKANSPPAEHHASPIGPIGTNGRSFGAREGGAAVPNSTIGTNGTGTVDPAQLDLADAIDAYRERLAICLEAGDVSEAEAHGIAAAEAGADFDTLAQRQAEWWRTRLDAWHPSVALAGLAADLRAVAGQPWLADAARAGWHDVSLFGVHPVAPLVRVECWGLGVTLAVSPHNRPGARVRLVSIDAARARIETPSRARFGIEQSVAAFDSAGPVWEVSEPTETSREQEGPA